MSPEAKEWIDLAPYETMLERWRNAPAGERIFRGDTGEYYAAVMTAKRNALPDNGVAASKRIGWNG